MKNSDSVPRSDNQTDKPDELGSVQSGSVDASDKKRDKDKQVDKKRKKRNLWPLKAFVITLFLAAAVNAASEIVLEDSQLWLASVLTVIILLLGVVFDIIGTAATSCDVGPFLSMASRKLKGAKLAVKLAQKSDVVSSVCNDIVGDVCGIVSGVCAAAIATQVIDLSQLNSPWNFIVSVIIYAVISTLTITLKAAGKSIAVNKANKIIFGVAKMLSIFRKEG